MITDLDKLSPDSTESAFINCDCMEAMRRFPDNYFDLAIVDPPYGDGGGTFASGTRFGERFDRYKSGGVARQAEIPPRYTDRERIAESRTEHGVTRTGGTWAEKYRKKSLRGMLPRSRSILMSCFASHETKLFGGAITLIYRLQDVF